MNILDKRERVRNTVEFRDLDIGNVYEDEEGVICIKTSYADDGGENNCIAFQKGDWDAYHQDPCSKVVRIEADLNLRRDR